MLTGGRAAAALAFISSAAVLTDGGAATELAVASSPVVLAGGGATAALASASFAAVLTYGGAATAHAFASFAIVRTDEGPSAFFCDCSDTCRPLRELSVACLSVSRGVSRRRPRTSSANKPHALMTDVLCTLCLAD